MFKKKKVGGGYFQEVKFLQVFGEVRFWNRVVPTCQAMGDRICVFSFFFFCLSNPVPGSLLFCLNSDFPEL